MRTSCNGCRVLRKACNDDCAIRPSLEWIKSPESQANATVFLAKFYGRAGLLNLISAALPNLRPAIFKSLLYEACGRIVDPVHGSVGLMWSGQWHHCQAAVDAVFKGYPVMQLPNSSPNVGPTSAGGPLSPASALRLCDIRRVSSNGCDPVPRTQTRTRSKPKGTEVLIEELDRSTGTEGDQGDSMFSNETVEHTVVNRAGLNMMNGYPGEEEPGLELTLGLGQYQMY